MKDAIERYRRRPRPVRLRCGVQHYAWGSLEDIPRLLGIDNADREPYAELWIGAHPELPSVALLEHTGVPLDELIDAAADVVLDPKSAERFDRRLPFLLKVLSAGKPLSIQAHPNKEQAQEGFARENAQGIPLTVPHRNYKDDNHKPELIAALTDFYALRGFRPLAQIAETLAATPELRLLASDFKPTRDSLIALYTQLMRMPESDVNAVLRPLLDRLRDEEDEKGFTRQEPAYWALRADAYYSKPGCTDRGIFSIFVLNLVHLKPGEAMYLPAGELHTYLEGTGIELMANSNNVLRGGLTPKHVAMDELLNILTFDSDEPKVLLPHLSNRDEQLSAYETPADEFALQRLQLAAGKSYRADTDHPVELMIVIEGSLVLAPNAGVPLAFSCGQALMVPYGLRYTISVDEPAVIFVATVPAHG